MDMIYEAVKKYFIKLLRVEYKIFFAVFFLAAAAGFFVPNLTSAATIFSDNFDSCTSNCAATTSGPPSEGGWNAWVTWYTTATYGGVTHNSAEITSPGRGGTGKSLKMWKAGSVAADYAGLNMMTFPGGNTYDHIFMRYYIKIPTAFTSGQNYKLWRLMTNSGTSGYNEIYLNYNYGTWSIYDGSPWQDLITWNQYQSDLHDGNWHSVEFEIGITSHILRFWIDDVLRYENTNRTWHLTGNLSGMQHFMIGNTYDHTGKWQSSWQAMEADDFVLSTTYVGSDGSIPPPNTPPSQYCGDQSCNNGETCSTCASDCGSCSEPPPSTDNPGTVNDLSATASGNNIVTLSFTEVGDGTGQPAKYDVRYATPAISWGSASIVTSGTCSTPVSGTTIGATKTCTITGLNPDTQYQFQLVSYRGILNQDAVFGGLSDVVSATTSSGTIPPRTYTLSDFTNLVTDWLKSFSGSPADVNSDGKVNSKDLGIMMSNWAF